MSDLSIFAHQVFDAQPFTSFLGAKLTRCAPGEVEMMLPIRDDLKQQHGFVHGGVISYLADNAITFAGGLALGGNALTSEFKINYIRPAVGSYLIVRASAVAAGKRQAVCRSEIFAVDDTGAEKLCALAQGTIVPSGEPDKVGA